MAKIYLSPAAHAHDNPCSYDKKCGENTHCNLYMDELEVYLKACKIEYKRAKKGQSISQTIKESNAYKPDIHYVSHTNAFNKKVSGSRNYVWLTGKGKAYAEIIMKHRKKIYPNACLTKTNVTWAEIRSTNSVAIYEELVFHDCKDDIKWFHENMRKMAEYTARAFCEIFRLKFVNPYYVAPIAPKPIVPKPTQPAKPAAPAKPIAKTPTTTSPSFKVGDKVKIVGTPTYYNSKSKVPLFIRVLKLYVRQVGKDKVLVSPFKSGAVTGWIKINDVKKV